MCCCVWYSSSSLAWLLQLRLASVEYVGGFAAASMGVCAVRCGDSLGVWLVHGAEGCGSIR